MTRSVAALAAVLVLAGPARTQISFSSDELFPYTPGEPVSFSVASTGADVDEDDRDRIDALIARTGADRTWDFTAIDYDQSSTSTSTFFEDSDGLPGAAEFPGANAVLRETRADSVSFTYGVLTADAYAVLGVFVPGGGGADYVQRYEPDGLRRVTFPFTIGTTVADEATLVVRPDPGAAPTVREEAEVVGFGTLVLPTGSYAALMERRTITATVTVAGQTITSAAALYSWTTKERAAATATNFETPQGARAYTAQYTGPGGGGTATEPGPAALALAAAPNPARGAAAVRLTTAAPLDARVAVWDALGRRVAVLWDGPVAAGTTAFALDAAALAPGVYVARADAGGRTLTVRLTVAR